MFFVLSKVLWALAQPGNLLMLGLAGGAVLLLTRWRRLGSRLVVGFAAVFAVVGSLPVGAWLLLPLENRFPANPPLPDRLAGVIVLGGATEPDLTAGRGQPALKEAAERLTALVALSQHMADLKVVHTGGSGELLGSPLSEAEVVARFLGEQGVDPARVIFEDRSRNTWENAVFTRELVRPEAGSCWLLVTSAWHMPRSVGVFRRAGWQVLPYPVDFRTTGALELFETFDVAERLIELDLAVHSWLGMVVYAWTGRSTAVFPAPHEPPCR